MTEGPLSLFQDNGQRTVWLDLRGSITLVQKKKNMNTLSTIRIKSGTFQALSTYQLLFYVWIDSIQFILYGKNKHKYSANIICYSLL